MKRSILPLLALAAALCSCDNESSENNTSTDASITVPVTEVAAPVTSEVAVPQATTASVGTVKHPPTKLGTLMNLNASRSTFTTASTGLNPAHGMPGHDCSLPVGAPLNGGQAAVSAPVQTVAQPTATPAPSNQLSGLTQPNFKVDPNMAINPAHGEPGHDCSIPVGAPLVKGDVKINPAHGEPGHDCSVAVGAPLPG